MKSLIVEDDFTSRMLVQQILAPYGEAHVAVNGKEAVAAFRMALDSQSPYDLVCLDVMMPEMDGREALRALRAMEAEKGLAAGQACIIMTTAVGDMKNIAGAYHDLCDGYLVKPVDKARLLDQLKKLGLLVA
jgi:two-component system, chemotaxis family, chemotaxis protein CheY